MNVLIAIAVAQAVLYGAIAWLSGMFAYGANVQQRPILTVLGLLVASFALYLVAIGVAVRCPAGRRLGWVIVGPAILFRCQSLLTPPIQEIDIYRYLWDGAVTARGVNPYRYAPAQVTAATTDSDNSEIHGELRRLVQLCGRSPTMAEVLGRVHYAELSTVYPPVSQAVFAASDWLTPQRASVEVRVTILKAVLLTFDVGTIVLVWLLLKTVGKHPGWVVAYAWCPLVIKEFANSGHLDSIAVFLTTAAVWCIARRFASGCRGTRTKSMLTGAILFALAVGSKLYAIVLFPLFVAAVASKCRPATTILFAVLAVAASAGCVAPMLLTKKASPVSSAAVSNASDAAPSAVVQPTHAATEPPADASPTTGLRAFLTRWEMNDFLFMLVIENVRPVDAHGQEVCAWFAIVPNRWREVFIRPVVGVLGTDAQLAAFLVARALTMGICLAIAIALAWRVYWKADVDVFLEAAFLTLAWFWLLLPTQNPWYWTWALPLVPFARGRAWVAVSGLALIYYLRFWFHYQFPDGPILGTPYDNGQVFDFIVTWLEYGPWFAWLGIAAIGRRRRTTNRPSASGRPAGD